MWVLLRPVGLHNGCLAMGQSQLTGHMTDCADQGEEGLPSATLNRWCLWRRQKGREGQTGDVGERRERGKEKPPQQSPIKMMSLPAHAVTLLPLLSFFVTFLKIP
ncbi:unnamed protein product [Pleuronectes platessa]|uniref:Uncharacterized protein n=1 Tax=Pleuronectes platessa TaxID=8262 RepID=A0A9N7YTV2_PLEPL|nr:unnamed protein product [Pleuronectes platessa]